MKYIKDLTEGARVSDIYLIKSRTSAVTKTGKDYWNVVLQDKTGAVDAKVWDLGSAGIEEFEAKEYVDIVGTVTVFNGALQVKIERARVAREGEYEPADYLPVSKYNIDEMMAELVAMIEKTENPYLKQLLRSFFVEDEEFIGKFRFSSAAKSVHHSFVGGLLEHTLSVAKNCEYFAAHYGVLNRDLLVAAAICHDIGKVREFVPYPENDYSDEGNLLGHIIIGAEMVGERIAKIPGFPVNLANELRHCILAHHGELEFGSPKKPAIIEAVALSFADNLDAKMETFMEALDASLNPGEWMGYNKFIESNIRGTRME
ncbi:MAG: HD domain-containing protein [Lachnospiraceae bacterium]|nr:HD domain-containing protein [Lachnospiraceae bacterium]